MSRSSVGPKKREENFLCAAGSNTALAGWLRADDCHFAGVLSLSQQTLQETSLNRRDQIFQ